MLVSERGPVQVSWCAVSGLLDHLLLPREEHTLQVQEKEWGFEECAHCDGTALLTHEYILPAHRGTGEGGGH